MSTSEDLRLYLDSQDDFALELEVYRHAKGFQFKASHAGLYDDPKTGRRRQYDVRAFYQLPNGIQGIYLTLECKSLDPTYPLLVQRVPRPRDEGFHQVILSRDCTSPHGTSREPQHWTGASLIRLAGTRMYDFGQPVGKSMKRVKKLPNNQGFSASDSDIYEKYTQALTSMDDLVQEAAEALLPRHNPPGLARAFLPVVVISDDALWVADYDASGQLTSDPRQVDETEFYLGWDYEILNTMASNYPATFTVSHLHIMTRSRLPRFLQEISQGGRGLEPIVWRQSLTSVPSAAQQHAPR